MSQKYDEDWLQKYTFTEYTFPPRINTELLPEMNLPEGVYCTGCDEVLPSLSSPCACKPEKQS